MSLNYGGCPRQRFRKAPPLDKKKALTELQESLKTVTPVKYPDNIKLVTKYYDKLSEAMQED